MSTPTARSATRVGFFAYGLGMYGLFLFTFCYAIGFIGNLVVPEAIDDGQAGPAGRAVLINVLLLSLFVLQHTIMARPAFKERWTRLVPRPIERATFVLATCIVLNIMYFFWQPLPQVVWSVQHPVGQTMLHALFAFGWVVVLYASFCIDHFDLFGLRQVVLFLRGRAYTHPGFAMPALYRAVRNPLMLGFLIAFWATPHMTQGHLLFSLLTTGYIFFGIAMEERDLLKLLGEDYRRYRARTPMILPWPRPRTMPVESGSMDEMSTTGA